MTVRDCPAEGECETVGDKAEQVYTSVPPGQSRGLDEHVYFSALPRFKGRFEWSYAVTSVRAK